MTGTIRPEWVTCIRSQRKENESYCGRNIAGEFHFRDIGHARRSDQQGSRMTTCEDCVRAMNVPPRDPELEKLITEAETMLKTEFDNPEATLPKALRLVTEMAKRLNNGR